MIVVEAGGVASKKLEPQAALARGPLRLLDAALDEGDLDRAQAVLRDLVALQAEEAGACAAHCSLVAAVLDAVPQPAPMRARPVVPVWGGYEAELALGALELVLAGGEGPAEMTAPVQAARALAGDTSAMRGHGEGEGGAKKLDYRSLILRELLEVDLLMELKGTRMYCMPRSRVLGGPRRC